jgi:hypothetical protein
LPRAQVQAKEKN